MHEAKSLHACGFNLLSAKLLVFSIKPYSNVKPFGEARVLRDFLIHGDLSEMKMLSGYRIRALGGVKSLFGPWEGSSNGSKFLNFGGGCPGGLKLFIRSLFFQLFLSSL